MVSLGLGLGVKRINEDAPFQPRGELQKGKLSGAP